jgi:hypothetical protein
MKISTALMHKMFLRDHLIVMTCETKKWIRDEKMFCDSKSRAKISIEAERPTFRCVWQQIDGKQKVLHDMFALVLKQPCQLLASRIPSLLAVYPEHVPGIQVSMWRPIAVRVGSVGFFDR